MNFLSSKRAKELFIQACPPGRTSAACQGAAEAFDVVRAAEREAEMARATRDGPRGPGAGVQGRSQQEIRHDGTRKKGEAKGKAEPEAEEGVRSISIESGTERRPERSRDGARVRRHG